MIIDTILALIIRKIQEFSDLLDQYIRSMSIKFINLPLTLRRMEAWRETKGLNI